MITSQFSSNKINSNSVEAFSLYEKSRFGEKKNEKIEYSIPEALYLVEKKQMQIFSNNRALTYEQILRKTKKLDKKIETKMPVFSNLRKKGYVLKTALKFGADFRVYKKGVKPGEDHALWLLNCFKESEVLNWHDFAAKNRVAHSTRKKLLLAIVDDEDSVTFFEVGWIKP